MGLFLNRNQIILKRRDLVRDRDVEAPSLLLFNSCSNLEDSRRDSQGLLLRGKTFLIRFHAKLVLNL